MRVTGAEPVTNVLEIGRKGSRSTTLPSNLHFAAEIDSILIIGDNREGDSTTIFNTVYFFALNRSESQKTKPERNPVGNNSVTENSNCG